MRRSTRERRQPERLFYAASHAVEEELSGSGGAAGPLSASDSDDESGVGEPAASSSSDSGVAAGDDKLDGEAEENAGVRRPRKRPCTSDEAKGQAAQAVPVTMSSGHAGPASNGTGQGQTVPVSGIGRRGPQAARRSKPARAIQARSQPALAAEPALASPAASGAVIGQAAPRTGVRKPLRANEPIKLQAVDAASLQPRPVSAANCAPSDVLFPPIRWFFVF